MSVPDTQTLDGPAAEHIGTVVGAAYGLVALASSAAAVVVPSIRSEFGLSVSAASWVITAFVVALAATAPIYGRLADRIGTRTPITVGLIVMAIGAVVAATAPNSAVLLIGRVIQGAGAGAVPVLAPAIIAARTTDSDRPRALTRMSTIAAAAAAGLLVGAAIAELVGWRPVIAIPSLALVLLPAVRRIGTTSRPARGSRFHVVGALTVAAIAVGVNLALQLSRSPTTGLVGIGIGVVGLGAARLAWRNNDDPFLPVSVLRRTTSWRLGLAAAAIPGSYFALLIAVPAILSERHNASRLAIGFLLFPAALAGASAGPLARQLRRHLPGTKIGAVGLGCSTVALITGSVFSAHPVVLGVAFALAAISFGLGQSALLNEVTAGTPSADRGAALALFMLTFFVGGGAGGALLSALTASMPIPTALGWLAALPAAAAVVAATTKPA